MVQLGLFSDRKGDVAGGAHVDIYGSGFAMPADDFSGTVLSALWTPTTTGSGSVLLVPGSPGRVQLSSGRKANSSAELTSADTYVDVDAELVLTRGADAQLGAGAVVAGLRLTAGVGTDAAIFLDDRLTPRVRVRNGGVTTLDQVLASGGPMTTIAFRILRVKEAVRFYMNGVFAFAITWVTDAATFGAYVANSTAASSLVVSHVGAFLRRPIVLFRATPAETVSFASDTHVACLAPPAPDGLPRLVDVTLISEASASVLPAAFTYELPPRCTRHELTVLSDPTLGGN